ncbi:MAG: hypothetical protein ACO3CG_03220 [Ilumatobacteraceae bacterium]
MTTALDHPHAALLQQHREQILALFATYRVAEVRLLDDSSQLRRPDLFDVEFVAELPRQYGYDGVGKLENDLETLTGLRVHLHELFVDCYANRTAREDSKPL